MYNWVGGALFFFVYSLADMLCPWRWWFSKVWQSRERWWLPHSLFKRLPFPHFIVLLPFFYYISLGLPQPIKYMVLSARLRGVLLGSQLCRNITPTWGGHNGGIAPSLFLPKVHIIDGGGEKIKRWGKF